MSEQTKTGGPAFPVPMEDRHCGMDLRDYFAAKAMQSLIQASEMEAGEQLTDYIESISAASYEYADAMLAAREVHP